ncbi:tetratricopeptide repeat protein [Roseovarius arcticus]|uniref:tetratricopeptide repeat protein n=1 Tax=Roseovarius arcticus TaxID=2547404 RepID=UPI001485E78B|nr:tetratricopeptide repeat protein [Roseovarius arcticus]
MPWPSWAQGYANGQAAYAQRDWVTAESLWEKEAQEGSVVALLGLGNLYDFGLVGASDPERAFSLYLEAAKAGLAEAAFNVAVMHDSGIGTPQDLDAAASWYSFAALGGNARAAYNLGKFFADGVGVERNETLAAYWYETVAESLTSASDAFAALPPAPSNESAEISAPKPLAMEVFALPAGAEARMAWQNRSTVSDATYRVDLIRIGTDGIAPLATARTPGSAVAIDLKSAETPFAWRVAQVAKEGYATSAWLTDKGEPMLMPPTGIVQFEFAPDDRRAEGLAYRLGGAMERFGSIIVYAEAEQDIETSAVSYRYPQDAAFAADVAAFLPGVGVEGALLQPDQDMAPEEVHVMIAFDRGED